MIIYFDAPSQALQAEPMDAIYEPVTELLRAHRRGHHLVTMPRATSKWLLENLTLGQPDRATLERIIDQHTQHGQLHTQADVYLRIALNPTNVTPRSQGELVLPLSELRNGYILDRAVLIVEDTASDGQFYASLLEFLGRQSGELNLAMEVIHGGGAAILNVLQDKINDRRIGAMILDSDRKSPQAPVPAKYHQALAAAAAWPLILVRCLACHEIENLVPLEVIEMLPCGKSNKQEISALLKIQRYEEQSAVEISAQLHCFYDLKKGRENSNCEWLDGKLNISGGGNFRGFGDKIIPQLLNKKDALHRFLRLTRQAKWRKVHGALFGEVMWIFVSQPRLFV